VARNFVLFAAFLVMAGVASPAFAGDVDLSLLKKPLTTGLPATEAPLASATAAPLLVRKLGATGLVSAELVAWGSANTQLARGLASYPAPALRVIGEVPLGATSFMVEFDDRELAGTANASGCADPAVRAITCDRQSVGGFRAREWTVQEHGGFLVPKTSIFVNFANLYRATNFSMDIEGIGFGAELLPTVLSANSPNGFFGSVYFYPNIMNEHMVEMHVTPKHNVPVRYSMLAYEMGMTRTVGKSRTFLDIGLRGDHSWSLVNAPRQGTKLHLFIGSGRHL
jgi:hypothetical protein